MEIAQGEFKNFEVINDGDNVFGYLALYELDKIGKNKYNYSYLLLDKNLNKVQNGEFVLESLESKKYLLGTNYNNGNLLLQFSNVKQPYATDVLVKIDLKKNQSTPSLTLVNDELIPVNDFLQSGLKSADLMTIKNAGTEGFLIQRFVKRSKDEKKLPILYDAEFLKAQKKFNDNKKEYFEMLFASNTLMIIRDFGGKDEVLTFYDIEDGQYKFKLTLHQKYNLFKSFTKETGDEIIIIGEYNESKFSVVNDGIFKLKINKKTGEIVEEISKPYSQLMVQKGFTGGPNKLRGFDILDNGNISVFGDGQSYGGPIFFVFNSNMEIQKIVMPEIGNKKPLYVQSVNKIEDKRGYIYSYIEENEKNYYFVNFSNETFDANVEKFEVKNKKNNSKSYPFSAKNGYIGIAEIYEKVEDNKVADLRLKKIN